MLEFLQAGLIGGLLNFWGQPPTLSQPIPLLAWETTAVFDVPTAPDPQVEKIVASYLQRLSRKGLPVSNQKVWIQSSWAELANYGGITPAAAASLTKVATSLGALRTWGLDHRFVTSIYADGPVQNGVLNGDLIVVGGGDPLFVWEEAIALGNTLQSLGMAKVKGNLILLGNFAMNFEKDGQKSGQLLKIALNSQLWTASVQKQFATLPPSTPKPQVEILGQVKNQGDVPAQAQLILRHQSLTVGELLKQMNLYSNNFIAESLAESLGGSDRLVQIVREKTKISPTAIQLINGSGLGVDNRLSPQAVCELLMTLEQELAAQGVSLSDLFPVGGRDKQGTMQWRSIPAGIAIKTGTLAQVSALAGMIPTRERGSVWFTIINSGSDIEGLRTEQDRLLQDLAKHWHLSPTAAALAPETPVFLGDPVRN